MNNRIIPSMHAERKITIHSHKHSFTPYPSLSPYWRTDRMTDRGTNTLAARGLEELFFQLTYKNSDQYLSSCMSQKNNTVIDVTSFLHCGIVA